MSHSNIFRPLVKWPSSCLFSPKFGPGGQELTQACAKVQRDNSLHFVAVRNGGIVFPSFAISAALTSHHDTCFSRNESFTEGHL
jgi:hypothetical protein